MFFEHAREQAERDFKANDKDAMVGAAAARAPARAAAAQLASCSSVQQRP